MTSKPLVGIIDISINNILSIKRAFENIGSKVTIIDEQRNVEKFDIIVLPGVGAYHEAMKKLRDTKLILSIEQALNKNKVLPMDGVCAIILQSFVHRPSGGKDALQVRRYIAAVNSRSGKCASGVYQLNVPIH